ncbi:hypothetical protein MSG28_003216 [Choristoneura fumiferana]|uniref:Uncharacterized protein n=1 Tax=Choristoneura fumiferana TaxID=7141 RepID=A0ACC0KEM9_CHOFU|nr:hypothetical protein MSG28_003216 [Choristoneura fumiferana]
MATRGEQISEITRSRRCGPERPYSPAKGEGRAFPVPRRCHPSVRGYVITELLQSDLHKIIVSPQHLSADHIKVFLYQILRVQQGGEQITSQACGYDVVYAVTSGIMEMQPRSSRRPVPRRLARQFICELFPSGNRRRLRQSTPVMAPEILMGANHYSAAVDVWSVGCIFGELLGRRILFQAQSPVQQMLVFDPAKRISVVDALAHPYLEEGRLRYHSCMCKCCYSAPPAARHYSPDLEPAAHHAFHDGWERKLTSVHQVKEEIHKFIAEQLQTSRVPLCINPQSAAFKSFASSRAGSKAKVCSPFKTAAKILLLSPVIFLCAA